VKHKTTKTKYHLRNWRNYNRALVQRGSLTVWFSSEVLNVWKNTQRTGKRGHPQTYSETAILTMATLQEIYHLGVRQTEGLLESLRALLHVEGLCCKFSSPSTLAIFWIAGGRSLL
jgi:Transposase DDE domain